MNVKSRSGVEGFRVGAQRIRKMVVQVLCKKGRRLRIVGEVIKGVGVTS